MTLLSRDTVMRAIRVTISPVRKLRARLLAPKPQTVTGFVTMRPRNNIEVFVSEDKMEALWTHVQTTWETLGSKTPHWSVITNDDFKPENFRNHESVFWETGWHEVNMIRDLCASANLRWGDYTTCLEYGCGVGRVTAQFSREFKRVLAIDISRPHLDLAEEKIKQVGATNVEFVQASRSMFEKLPKYDFLYSRLVLQHNPPPIMAFLLKRLLDGLEPGGVAIFQILPYITGYQFAVPQYLRNVALNEAHCEMHCLPQVEILSIVREAGARVLEMRENGDAGGQGFVSNIFVVAKDLS